MRPDQARQREIAVKYNITQSAVNQIKRGVRFASVREV